MRARRFVLASEFRVGKAAADSGLRKTHEAPIQAVASDEECRAAQSFRALVLWFDAHCDWLRSFVPGPVRLRKHLWHDLYSSADRNRLIRHLNRRFLPSENASLEKFLDVVQLDFRKPGAQAMGN